MSTRGLYPVISGWRIRGKISIGAVSFANRSNKGHFFPLRNPASRARSHADNLAEEEPLILDPWRPGRPARA